MRNYNASVCYKPAFDEFNKIETENFDMLKAYVDEAKDRKVNETKDALEGLIGVGNNNN